MVASATDAGVRALMSFRKAANLISHIIACSAVRAQFRFPGAAGIVFANMSDDELYEAWEKALGLRQQEELREAWPSLDILIELLNRLIALRDNTQIEK